MPKVIIEDDNLVYQYVYRDIVFLNIAFQSSQFSKSNFNIKYAYLTVSVWLHFCNVYLCSAFYCLARGLFKSFQTEFSCNKNIFLSVKFNQLLRELFCKESPSKKMNVNIDNRYSKCNNHIELSSCSVRSLFVYPHDITLFDINNIWCMLYSFCFQVHNVLILFCNVKQANESRVGKGQKTIFIQWHDKKTYSSTNIGTSLSIRYLWTIPTIRCIFCVAP